jgi:hypothetical protein
MKRERAKMHFVANTPNKEACYTLWKKKDPPITPFSRMSFLALIRTANPALRLFKGSKQNRTNDTLPSP